MHTFNQLATMLVAAAIPPKYPQNASDGAPAARNARGGVRAFVPTHASAVTFAALGPGKFPKEGGD